MTNDSLKQHMAGSLIAYSFLSSGKAISGDEVQYLKDERLENDFEAKKTALLMLGFQNEYFSESGLLNLAIADTAKQTGVLENSLALVEKLKDSSVEMVSVPMRLVEDESDIKKPVGILATMRDSNAFTMGTEGVKIINELAIYGDRIAEIPGRRSFDAFQHTDLEYYLRSREINTVVLLGAVASICIESTGRSAIEKGFNVVVLSDCLAARTKFEHEFYCTSVFPMYALVMSSQEFMEHTVC